MQRLYRAWSAKNGTDVDIWQFYDLLNAGVVTASEIEGAK